MFQTSRGPLESRGEPPLPAALTSTAWAEAPGLPVWPVLPESMSRPREWNSAHPESSGQGSAARNKGTPQMLQMKEQENMRRLCAEVISSRGEAVRVRMVDPPFLGSCFLPWCIQLMTVRIRCQPLQSNGRLHPSPTHTFSMSHQTFY